MHRVHLCSQRDECPQLVVEIPLPRFYRAAQCSLVEGATERRRAAKKDVHQYAQSPHVHPLEKLSANAVNRKSGGARGRFERERQTVYRDTFAIALQLLSSLVGEGEGQGVLSTMNRVMHACPRRRQIRSSQQGVDSGISSTAARKKTVCMEVAFTLGVKTLEPGSWSCRPTSRFCYWKNATLRAQRNTYY